MTRCFRQFPLIRLGVLLSATLFVAAPAPAQDKGTGGEPNAADSGRQRQVLHHLAQRQKEAASELRARLLDMELLVDDLRRRDENRKADVLQKAIKIVSARTVEVDPTRASAASGDKNLATLEAAMAEMARILKERPDDVARVQDIGKRVVTVLDKIVETLTSTDQVADLEQREKEVRDAIDEARGLRNRQEQLTERTRRTMPPTPAEKAAQLTRRELQKLRKELAKLDEDAQRELADVDRAREQAAKLRDLLRRQQRLQRETAVRAGTAKDLAPQLNRNMAALAELARQARKAEEEDRVAGHLAELAREVDRLAKRQEELAREGERREALEDGLRALRRRAAAPGEQDKQQQAALAKAAAAAKQGAQKDDGSAQRRAAAIRAAAQDGADKQTRERGRRALKETLDAAPSPETLARDQEVLGRDVLRAQENSPEQAAGSLQDAARLSQQAGKEFREENPAATKSARNSADLLRKTAAALQREAAQMQSPAAAKQRAAKREATAKSADELAKKLDELGASKAAKDGGLDDIAKDGAEAAKRAAQDLRKAAANARADQPREGAENARNAAERAENAARSMRSAVAERDEVAQRQGQVADDLARMGSAAKQQADAAAQKAQQQQANGGSSPAQQKAQQQAQAKAGQQQANAQAMQNAAQKAKQARQQLQQGKLDEAGAAQREVVAELQKLTKQAEDAVQQASARNQAAINRAKQRSEQIGKKAAELAQKMAEGARTAREGDARERLERAAAKTREAEEAMRRSLQRLAEAMPKSAEQDRKEAGERIDQAMRDLKGVRERGRPDANSRSRMQDAAQKQQALRDDVRRLEERLKRLKENDAAESMQDAQSAMNQAEQRLQEGDADEAERAQQRAQKALEQAEKKLAREQRRYRDLRQYELLFKLKEELKAFRRAAQAHHESLQQIDAKVREAGRVSRNINRRLLGPLRNRIKTLRTDIDEKADAIEKEGAVVYTYILKGCAADLQEIEGLLALKDVGLIPQELLGDVVRRFDLAIKGLERDLRERKENEQQQQQQQQQQDQNQGQQKPALVPPDAEIRMVMVLQRSLNTERENFFANRPDFGSRKPTETEKARVERLYHQQGSLAELFDNLRRSFASQAEASEADEFGLEKEPGQDGAHGQPAGPELPAGDDDKEPKKEEGGAGPDPR